MAQKATIAATMTAIVVVLWPSFLGFLFMLPSRVDTLLLTPQWSRPDREHERSVQRPLRSAFPDPDASFCGCPAQEDGQRVHEDAARSARGHCRPQQTFEGRRNRLRIAESYGRGRCKTSA